MFVTDAANREVLEYDGASGAILRWYAYGLGSNDVLNQMNVVAATRATLVPDILGSVIGSQDSSSGTLTKAGYLPYGKSANAPGTFGYTAQRIDPESGGLYYYRARHYSPAWGRFLQPDPIGYAGGVNLYAYVGNDPLNVLDLMGLSPDSPRGYGSNAIYAADNLRAGNYGTAAYYELLQTLDTAIAITPFGALENAAARGVTAARLAANAAARREFEQAGIQALNAAKNTTIINVPGITKGSIPDVLSSGLTEFKNAVEINNSLQLRIQTGYAILTGQPLNLVVGPSTQRVSQSLQQAIAGTGGTIQRFNPATGVFAPFP